MRQAQAVCVRLLAQPPQQEAAELFARGLVQVVRGLQAAAYRLLV